MQQASHDQLRLKQPAYWNTPSPATEEKLLAHWREHDLAGQLHAARAGKRPFWLLDGPPYANGDAHLGHLLNKVLKDVHARYASACGRQLTWRAGWDCHGLPLEMAVEKRHGRQAKVDAGAFLQQCRLEATRWKDQQATSMARTGLLCNLDQPWLTMDPAREATTLSLLLAMWQAGLLVERQSPVHWCPACQSALAASELEKANVDRLEATFTAPLSAASCGRLAAAARAAQRAWPDGPLHLLSWTTTPWTLWANAGFGHPPAGPLTVARLASGVQALLAVAARDRLLLASPELFSDPGLAYDGVFDFAALPAMDLMAASPLTDLAAPLLAAPFASEREGSGFVHLAPAFGPEDFALHERDGVRLDCHVGPDGRLRDGGGGPALPDCLAGLTLGPASHRSCELLAQAGRLVLAEQRGAEATMCWRHKKPVFYRASAQWAMDLHQPFAGCPEGLAARATAALEHTVFVPDAQAKAPLALMLATRRYWTLSRDRLWGLPLPFFRHETSGALHPDTASLWSALAQRVRSEGVEAWQSFPTPAGYRKSGQSVDVWFDSGAAFLCASEHGAHQADLAVEGQDQTRGWFLSSFLLHAFKSALPPFRTVMTHRFVVDEHGRKFSKSAGGTPDHNALFDKAGADVFRLWVCGQSVSDEMKWSDTSLRQASQDAKDWRSFLRFQLANMEERADSPRPALHARDSLALARLARTERAWHAAMGGGRFNHALTSLAQFRQWASAEWFELSKRTLYCAPDGDAALASVQWALRDCFLRCAQMLGTVMPFACEEAYLAWPGHPLASLFLHELAPATPDGAGQAAAHAAMERDLAWRRSLLPLVEKARPLVGKGMPVCLAFAGTREGARDEAEEDALRALFPGCFVVRGDSEDALEEWVEQDGGAQDRGEQQPARPEEHWMARAGRPRAMPQRCKRCRDYFGAGTLKADVCTRCTAETSSV